MTPALGCVVAAVVAWAAVALVVIYDSWPPLAKGEQRRKNLDCASHSQGESEKPSTPRDDNRPEAVRRTVGYVVRKFRDYCARRKQENPQDKFSRRLAHATVIIAFL